MPYTPNPQHRNRNFANKKSQWSISIIDENNCYNAASDSHWEFNNCLWGLYLLPQSLAPQVLGLSPSPSLHSLQMAKFVGDELGNWHGYPVAHWMSPYDKPGENILKDWCDRGIIRKVIFSKIRRGKKCVL
ncbi:hypothetical protein [Pectobacterium punjabense]|uniref:hypothetical protein n=1 Tax=Pectobacterium punjabense TaxID=2108399 RepID=UPI0019693F82|nr:hypothetical protein [Pectobacterium punjabense]MBN3138130.1 hypothetical protein [Pectobacterium punjabense]